MKDAQLANINSDIKLRSVRQEQRHIRQYQNRRKPRKQGWERERARSHIQGVRRRFPSALSNEGPSLVSLLQLWLENTKGNPCPYCGREVDHIDHKHPLILGGIHSWDNIQRVCANCNWAKGSSTEEEFIDWISGLISHQLTGGHSRSGYVQD